MKSDLLEKELSYKLIGIFLKVGRQLGINFKEYVYLNAIKEELILANIKFVDRPKLTLFSIISAKTLGYFIPDILVEDKIIIEIKVQKSLMESSINQLISYLKNSRFEIGFLVNFGTSYIQIIRRIYTNDRKKFLKN